MRRTRIKVFLLLMLAVALMRFFSGCTHVPEKPNIVLILADDLGWNQLGCYGSTFYETPNLDRMAQQGMRFTNAYAAGAVCSPTRASIMTGKYPARLHVTKFISPQDYSPREDARLLEPEWTPYLPLGEETIAEVLKELRYVTACFGKWHLSRAKTPPESLAFNPDKQGFDEHFVTYKPVPAMAKEWQTAENDAHNVRIITEKSLEFIERNRDKPFFLFVSYNTIHTPLMEKESLISKFRKKPDASLPTNHPIIGAMIETLDLSIGQLLAKLDELELSEKTMVLFFSDNGGLDWTPEEGQVADNSPLRAGKGDRYEGGIRVPLIVRWPPMVVPASVCHEPVISVDLFPTFLKAAGGIKGSKDIDGLSLLPLLTQSGPLDRETLYWHYPHYHKFGAFPSSAIRQGRYKLIEWHEARIYDLENQYELYDLVEDLGETNNLASSMPEKTRDLAEDLEKWRHSVEAQMPKHNPDYLPEGKQRSPEAN